MAVGLCFSELALILLVGLLVVAFQALMIYGVFLIVRPLFRRRHHDTGQT